MHVLQRIRPAKVGCGIAVRGRDLVAVAVRWRAGEATVLGRVDLRGFRERPPADWGAEYKAFVQGLRIGHVAAALCLPREEVVVRRLLLPSTRATELSGVVDLQVPDLHPYGEGSVYHDSVSLDPDGSAGRSRRVAVAIAEAERIESYFQSFVQAGIPLAACTVSAGALRAAARLRSRDPLLPLALAIRSGPSLEIYGESSDCPLLSSSVDLGGMTLQGALRLTHDGLRPGRSDKVRLLLLGDEMNASVPGFDSQAGELVIALPSELPEGFSPARDVVALGAAVESARPRLGLGLNLLPDSLRRANSVAPFAPRLALAAALVLVGIASVVRPFIQDGRYADRLRREAASLESGTAELGEQSGRLSELRSRYRWLRDRQERVRTDLELLRELSRILPPAAVLSTLQIDDSRAVLAGIAEAADPLLAILASSPLLEDVRFSRAPADGEGGDLFQIEGRRGR